MIETPQFVVDALRARHPDVACVYVPSMRLFHLRVFWGGQWKHIRWIEQRTEGMQPNQRGAFLWPNLWNTVEWLNQKDTWGKAQNSWQLKALQEHLLTKPTEHRQKVKKAKVSEMVRLGMAPELAWAFRKSGL